jgi:dihydrofolate reductase
MRPLTLIAAHAHGRVIGNGPAIPWHSSDDFAHFKATTLGHTLVMGRLTYDSIGRPLPGRRTIVITRDPEWSVDGVDVAHSMDEALAQAGDAEVYVAGGAQIYELALPYATEQILTEIDLVVPGDVFYPEFDASQWREVRRIERPDLDPPLQWVWWERIPEDGQDRASADG